MPNVNNDDTGSLLTGSVLLRRGDRVHIMGEAADRWVTFAIAHGAGARAHFAGQGAVPMGAVTWERVPGEPFDVGEKYGRKEVRKRLGDPEWEKGPGGNWGLGHAELDGQHVLFVNIGEARTGDDYGNVWHEDTRELEWTGVKGSRRGTPFNQALMEASGRVFLFVRTENKDDFTFQGRGVALRVGGADSPFTVRWGIAEEPTADPATLEERIVRARSRGQVGPPRGNDHPERIQVAGWGYRRDVEVAADVQTRAKGKCEVCLKPAPFSREDGSAFLETHHVWRLTDGGPDTTHNAVAACPNCHRELHSGTVARRAEILEILYVRHAFLKRRPTA